jgi:hypothetical protein
VKRLEAAFYERSRREYELTKHVSLAQLDPAALLELRETGSCQFAVPEWLFDLDHPGHYFRRIKSVSLSIPCVAGPFTSVAATLRLMGNELRTQPTLLGGTRYARTQADDPRFRPGLAGIHSIATSEPQHDDGLFELNFQDERYLPFEGAGAISAWKLEMNKELAQFDLRSIADVVLHISHTAREDSALADPARAEVVRQLGSDAGTHGVRRVFDLRQQFPDRWHRFVRPAAPGTEQQLVLDELATRLPFYTRRVGRPTVRRLEIVADLTPPNAEYQVRIEPLDVQATLAPHQAYGGLHHTLIEFPAGPDAPELGEWTLKLRDAQAPNFASLPPDALSEMYLIVHLGVA